MSREEPRPAAHGAARSWLHAYRLQLIASIVSVLLVFACGEIAVRLLGVRDQDGNFTFGARRLRPYHLPVNKVAAAVRQYAGSSATMIVYDAALGWSPRPSAINAESMHNADGLRVDTAERRFDPQSPAGVARIALFGDSFVYGSEVEYRDTWAFHLERLLRARGRAVEVLNFGVPGYGADQAFLRWTRAGSKYEPDLVIFGLQLENMHRNVNLIRPFYIPVVDLPFSKPRFVDRDGRLNLINQPPVPPEGLPDVIARFNTWELRQHEAFYRPERYEARWWYHSRLLSLAVPALLERTGGVPRDDALTADKQELTFRILSEFAQGVEAHGAQFRVLHLPTRADLQTLSATGRPPLPEFLERVRARFGLIDPAEDLLKHVGDGTLADLFRPGGHYTARGNGAVAAVLDRHVMPAE